VTTTSANTSSS